MSTTRYVHPFIQEISSYLVTTHLSYIPSQIELWRIRMLIEGLQAFEKLEEETLAAYQKVEQVNPEIKASQYYQKTDLNMRLNALKRKNDFEINIYSGDTLLDLAIRNRQLEIAQLLLEAKADPNIKTSLRGLTAAVAALDQVSDFSNSKFEREQQVAELVLRDERSIVNVTTRVGTLLDLALNRNPSLTIINLLLIRGVHIQNSEQLSKIFKCLKSYDQKDLRVLDCFIKVIEQLKKDLEIKDSKEEKNEQPKSKWDPRLISDIHDYFVSLKTSFAKVTETIATTITTLNSEQKVFPKGIATEITDFCFPVSQASIFNGSKQIAELKQQNPQEILKPSECNVM